MRNPTPAATLLAATLLAAPLAAQDPEPAAPAAVMDSAAPALTVSTRAAPGAPDRASNWLGLQVRTLDDQSLGEVRDLALDVDRRVIGVAVGVGGLLGIGATEVLIPVGVVSLDMDGGAPALRAGVTMEEVDAAIAAHREQAAD